MSDIKSVFSLLMHIGGCDRQGTIMGSIIKINQVMCHSQTKENRVTKLLCKLRVTATFRSKNSGHFSLCIAQVPLSFALTFAVVYYLQGAEKQPRMSQKEIYISTSVVQRRHLKRFKGDKNREKQQLEDEKLRVASKGTKGDFDEKRSIGCSKGIEVLGKFCLSN